MKLNSTSQQPVRPLGGQASLSLFGIPGVAEASTPCPQPQGPRIVHGQTYGQRARRYSRGIVAGAIAAKRSSVAVGVMLPMPKCWEPAVASTMRLAALAADERERVTAPDLEEFARPLAWGHTEAALALD